MPKIDTLIIIPAHNEAALVGDTVRDILNATQLPVVVVDDASTDDTATKARNAGAQLIPLATQLGAWGRHRQDSDTPSKTATAMWSPLTPTGSTMHKVSITCSQPCARKTQTWSSAPAPTAEVRQEKRPGHCCVPCPDSPCVISLPVSGYTHTKVSHFLQVGPPPASTIRISASYA